MADTKQTNKVNTIQEQGKCPKCGSLHITYEKPHFEGEYAVFPAKCDKCGCNFDETFWLDYVKSDVKEG